MVLSIFLFWPQKIFPNLIHQTTSFTAYKLVTLKLYYSKFHL